MEALQKPRRRVLLNLSCPPALLARLPRFAKAAAAIVETPSAKSASHRSRRRALSKNKPETMETDDAATGDGGKPGAGGEFASAWPWYEQQATRVLAESNADICAKLSGFLADNQRDWLARWHQLAAATQPVQAAAHLAGRLPFAALHSGVNTPDRDAMLAGLTNRLAADGGFRLAQVDSGDLLSATQLFSKALAQWLPEMSAAAQARKLSGSVKHSFLLAAEVYRSAFELPDKQQQPAAPQLVLLIRDFDEASSSKALNKFILVSSHYSAELPVAIVCSLSKTPASLQSLLSSRALARLSVRFFQSAAAGVLFDRLLDRVLINCPERQLRLSRATFDCLVEAFEDTEFSISAFMLRLKLALLWHIQRCSRHQAVDPAHIRHQRAAPLAIRLLDSLLDWRSKRLIYSLLLSNGGHLVDDPDFKERLARFLELNTETVLDRVNATRLMLQRAKQLDDDAVNRSLISGWLGDLDPLASDLAKRLEETAAAANSSLSMELPMELTSGSGGGEDGYSPQKLTRQMQRQNFAAEVNRRAEQRRIGANLRARLAACLINRLRADLPAPASLPDSGSVYADCRPMLIAAFAADPAGRLERQLLQAAEPDSSAGVSVGLTDLGVAFRLHKECRKLIRIVDLMRAFATCRRDGDDKDHNDAADENPACSSAPSPMMQVRFLRACAQLQLMGYVRLTRRKPDFMTRLTTA